jgi:hypothetical protein
MEKSEQLAALYLQDRKKDDKSLGRTIFDGAASGASLGFVAPALVSSAIGSKPVDGAIKAGKVPLTGGLGQQLIDSDFEKIYSEDFRELQKQKGANYISDDIKRLETNARKKAKLGRSKMFNENLAVQTGVGRYGAAIGAGIGVGSALLNRRKNQQKNDKLKKIIGNNNKNG